MHDAKPPSVAVMCDGNNRERKPREKILLTQSHQPIFFLSCPFIFLFMIWVTHSSEFVPTISLILIY